MSEIKVRYRRKDGGTSTAYIESHTGVGQNKYSDEEIELTWNGEEWCEK